MHDRSVRLRRAVVGLLVASLLILLTAYIGESVGRGLHSVQRGVVDAVSPIHEGASRVVKPVRDLFGWAGDTLDAKGQLKHMRKQRDQLRQQLIDAQAQLQVAGQIKGIKTLNAAHALDDNAPVLARVIAKDMNIWYDQVTIDKGSSSHIERNQAVVNGEGLVGRVTAVSGVTAIVTLITNHNTQVGATISGTKIEGIVGVQPGHPTELQLTSLSGNDVVRGGQLIVTSGTTSRVGRFRSPYPRDIPIGRVTRVDNLESDEQTAQVAPFADVRGVDVVEVLTKNR